MMRPVKFLHAAVQARTAPHAAMLEEGFSMDLSSYG